MACWIVSNNAHSNSLEGIQQPQCMLVDEGMENVNVLPFMSHFNDAAGQIELPDPLQVSVLIEQLRTHEFERVVDPGNQYTLGGENTNHWLRFCVTNSLNKELRLVLETSPAVLAQIDFYPQKPGAQSFQTGNARPMATRDIYSPEFDFTIELEPKETQTFYLRANSRTNAYLVADIWHKPVYLEAKDKIEITDGLFAGIVLGLILYTLLLYASVRQSSSLLYILWSTSTLILFASIDGRVLQFAFPNNPLLSSYGTILFYPLSVILSALFAQHFMKLRNFPRLNKVGIGIVVIFTLLLVLVYPFGYSLYFRAAAVFAFLVVLYFGLIAPVYALITKQSVTARYLLMAQLPLIICILDRTLFSIGLTNEHYVPYTAKVGLVAEKILLAYYIGVTIYQDKDKAQREALKQLQISNELKTNYNTELQVEIERNTAEISAMNADLEQQAKQLTELNEAKSQFFANISHEFRTPLTLIQGPLTQLLERGDKAKHSEQIIGNAIQQSKALQGLIDQLLTLSKFDGESLALKASNTNITHAIRAIVSQFTSLAESRQIGLSFESNAPDLEAFVDREKLQIILNNLISNALKFSEQGGQVAIQLSSHAEANTHVEEYSTDQYLQITVTDNGHGIPVEELEFVFDRFFQSKSSNQAGTGAGTGIGLALVKELVKLHAGDVTVSSVHQAGTISDQKANANTGTCFSITLPLGAAHLSPHEIAEQTTDLVIDAGPIAHAYAENSSNGATSEKPESGVATILVVDDNTDMRAYIRSVLEPLYTVIEAIDGINGEEVLQQHRPDMIITDLMMPNRDGLQFVEVVKSRVEFASIPIIMLTAKAGQENRLKGLLAAVDDYMTKPFDAHELTLRIKNLLLKQAQFKAFYQSPTGEPETGSSSSVDDNYLSKLRNIVEKRLPDTGFGVNQLAQEMHVSKATLNRRLSANYSFTASEFIRQCRLEKARQLSSAGAFKTVAELASAVGFKQAGYFSRLYHKTFNSPLLEKR